MGSYLPECKCIETVNSINTVGVEDYLPFLRLRHHRKPLIFFFMTAFALWRTKSKTCQWWFCSLSYQQHVLRAKHMVHLKQVVISFPVVIILADNFKLVETQFSTYPPPLLKRPLINLILQTQSYEDVPTYYFWTILTFRKIPTFAGVKSNCTFFFAGVKSNKLYVFLCWLIFTS